METVLLTDHTKEIQKHVKILDVAINKLYAMKQDYMVSQTELKIAENYIEKLREQIKVLKLSPVKPTKIPTSSIDYLAKLQKALELNDIDTEKITASYIKRKGYN